MPKIGKRQDGSETIIKNAEIAAEEKMPIAGYGMAVIFLEVGQMSG